MKCEIVIPTYNAGSKIYETLKGNYENGYEKFTIVNDGSRDNTSPEIERFEKDYGAESVQSKYIFLLDDDTIICSSPSKLKEVCKKMEKNIKASTVSVQPWYEKSLYFHDYRK